MADPTIDAWTRANAEYTDAWAEQAWAQDEITWGVWQVPESELRALPDVTGKDVVELGCGTVYFGAWLKKAGAAGVVAVDPILAQLETARRCNERFGLGLEFVEAFGEEVPLPTLSFDLAVSEYGASIWADPYRWIAEAARLLRPGGELVFLGNSTLAILARPRRTSLRSRRCSARSSGCTASNGRTAASSTTSRTASGSGCCARTASRSST